MPQEYRPNLFCCDLYDLPAHLRDTFDIVFSSYGTVGWLPRPGSLGFFDQPIPQTRRAFHFLQEFRVVVWMFDNDFTTVQYNYFKDEAIGKGKAAL